MQAAVRSALLVGLLCACQGTNTAAPDAGSGSDAGTGPTGLRVTWSSTPQIPGSIGNNLTVTYAVFRVDSLRVIGDAGPGDPRTSQTDFVVRWDSDSHPDAILFSDAPTGLYSKVTVQADGHLVDDSYEIDGKVALNGQTQEFQIHDRDALTANLDITTMLDPGTEAQIPILVRIDQALGVLDFSQLSYDDGHLELDTFDAQMPAFRAKLAASFVLGGSTGTPGGVN